MTTRSSHVRWALVSSTGLLLVLAVAYLGGASLLSAPRKPPAPATPVVVDANGNAVGTVAGMTDDGLAPVVLVHTSEGDVALYVFSDHLAAPRDPKSLEFTLPDCAGTPYLRVTGLPAGHSMLRWGTVLVLDQNLYVATTTTVESPPIRSYRDQAGVCFDYFWSSSEVVPVVAVGNIYQQYPPPYSVEWR